MDQVGFVFLFILLRVLSWLPYSLVAHMGSALGSALYMLPGRRRHIVKVNLRLCFPGRSEREYDALARNHFRHVICSYLERGIQWFGSERTIRKLVEVESEIDLDDPHAGIFTLLAC